MSEEQIDDFQPPAPNAQPLPLADVTAAPPGGNVEYEAYPVRKPEEDLNDFKVQVRASTLARCRGRLVEASKAIFPWHEAALGVSTMAAGAFLGALPADIEAGSFQTIFFYNLLPIIAAATFIAYLFLRRTTLKDPAKTASDVLAELPDPEKTR